MGGIYFDMEAFRARMIQECGEMLTLMGFDCVIVETRQSFWRRLWKEIANRPRVF